MKLIHMQSMSAFPTSPHFLCHSLVAHFVKLVCMASLLVQTLIFYWRSSVHWHVDGILMVHFTFIPLQYAQTYVFDVRLMHEQCQPDVTVWTFLDHPI